MTTEATQDTGNLEGIDEDGRVHEWRRQQLESLGLPGPLARLFADRVDWHEVADLVGQGCPLHLALEIAW